jgi:hypothetical protein
MKYTGVVTAPRDVRVAFVEQEPPMLPGTCGTARHGTVPDLVNLTFLSFEYVCIPVLKGVSVLDALLGEVGENVGSTRLRGGQSVYATVRRYRRAAQNVETDRKFNYRDACIIFRCVDGLSDAHGFLSCS